MSELIIYIIIGALSAILSWLLSKNRFQKKIFQLEEKVNFLLQEKENNNLIIKSLNKDKNTISEEKNILKISYAQKEIELKNMQEKLDENKSEITKLQEKFTKDFELLATKILDEKSSKFTEQNKENLKTILNPLHEKIQTFEKKVEQTHKESIDYHAALRQQIFGLKELNEQMSKEAVNLTRALKGDSKTQGNWGELVLERVLEKSGLEKGREYFVQQSFTTEDNKRQMPDVVIHLPENKKMIIDSKVSLTAYEQYISEDDENKKQAFLKAHIQSLQRHIEQLSDKKYEEIYHIESPDFVLLFVPVEPAFAVAINQDSNIYNKAFEKNIIIVTPTTLLATLRTIDSMWNNEKQQKNALEIAKQAGNLYDKFEGLVKDLIGIGKRIDASKADYNAAMNKLVDGRGNLISSVEKLKIMGAKAKKSLPQNIIDRANEKNE